MEQLIYFDNAATSFPKPENVYTFMDQFFRRAGVNPGRSGYDLCIEAGHTVLDDAAEGLGRADQTGRNLPFLTIGS